MTALDYRSLFEIASDGMIVIDSSLHIVRANAAFAAMVGVPVGELTGTPIVALFHADELKASPVETNAVIREGTGITVRRFRRPDGTPRETEVVSNCLDDGGMLCVVRDTSRPIAGPAVRDTEARFSAVAENIHAGLVVTDLENRATFVNGYMCERTGYAPEELIGRNLGPIFFGVEEQERHETRLRLRKAGVREVYEVAHRRKDGTAFLAEVSAAPLHDGAGRMIGTVAVVIDISERYEWEHELAEREHRYRLLFEVMPLPAWVYDVESYEFLAVNPAAVEHYGYSAEQFLGMTILDVRPPEDVTETKLKVLARRRGYAAQKHGWGHRHRKADGTVIDVEITSHSFDFEGRQARVVVVNDVTEENRMRLREREVEEQLLQAQKMEAVGRLAGGVAHDFNNLLSVVLNAAAALELELPADSGLHEDVGDIRQAVERGAALTRQLLAFGRKEVHAPARVDLHEVVKNVERLLARALAGQATLVVRRDAPAALAMADASQLEQVLVNLVINARDAMPSGGTVTITSGISMLDATEGEALGVAAGAYASIEVSDTGVGMDDETLRRAFEPFFTTKGPHRGTGLGLATVYGIVRQSGGAVRLASVPGAGTQVTVLLPDGGAGVPAEIALPGERLTLVQGSRTVLLVEDEPLVRAQARRLLERCGFAVIEAADGLEGERQFDAHRTTIGAIATDVVMPRLGGVEMVARLREREPTMPVVFVSGYTAEDRDLGLDERTAFVPKPYTMATLCGALTSVMAAVV
jgi:two-component system, cell cycle sensor histidine kinase and response regulator CckA